MFVYKARTVEQLCWLVWRKSPEPQSESTLDKSGDSGMSSYVFAGRARTYQRVIKWMENPISVSARIMRFPLLSAGSGTFVFEIAAYLKETKAERRLGGEKTEWYTLKWFSKLVHCPIFMGEKDPKIASLCHLKCYFFRIWSEILGHISVFPCSQSLLSQLWCSRCFIIKTKLRKSLNLLPPHPHPPVGICSHPREILNCSRRHSCSFVSCKIYTSILKHSDCWHQTLHILDAFRPKTDEHDWLFISLDNRHFSWPEECKAEKQPLSGRRASVITRCKGHFVIPAASKHLSRLSAITTSCLRRRSWAQGPEVTQNSNEPLCCVT